MGRGAILVSGAAEEADNGGDGVGSACVGDGAGGDRGGSACVGVIGVSKKKQWHLVGLVEKRYLEIETSGEENREGNG